MGDVDDNPFRLPPDDQIFLIREQERQRKLEERARVKHLKVWEKQTSSSRVLLGKKIGDVVADASAAAAPKKVMKRSRSDGMVRDARREKENVADFVAKKREMFLVQMNLDVKNAEIKKLNDKTLQKDEALKRSQQMLDEDVSRFDAFLQNNDQKAHKAMKDAEEETKKKQDRMQRIKHLKSQLSAVQSEIAKHREQKEECMKYKAFLEKLTPLDWKEQKAEEKLQRKRDRRQRYVDGEMAKYNQQMEADIAQERRALEEQTQEALKGRRNRREQEEAAKAQERELERRKQRIRRRYPTEEAVAGEYVEVSSGEEMPLYFNKPNQLMEVFATLEEQNLFLIQASQDKEQTLEEIQQKFTEKKQVMGSQIGRLQESLAELEGYIKDENDQCEVLRQQAMKASGTGERNQMLEDLTSKIIEVHCACGHDPEHDPNPKQMLRGIEVKLEEFLSLLDEEEAERPEVVEGFMKKKEKDRREFVKQTRKAAMERKISERLETSLARSQQPVHKKVGKQIMFTSPPLYQARRVIVEDEGLEESIKEHAIFGVYIDRKDGIPYPDCPQQEEK
jgi:hypothetical protein